MLGDIYCILYQTDIGETRGEIFFCFTALEELLMIQGRLQSVCFMFTFSRHMDGKSKCFDLWTSYSEYELNRNALLDQLMYVNIEIYMGCWVFPPKY